MLLDRRNSQVTLHLTQPPAHRRRLELHRTTLKLPEVRTGESLGVLFGKKNEREFSTADQEHVTSHKDKIVKIVYAIAKIGKDVSGIE